MSLIELVFPEKEGKPFVVGGVTKGGRAAFGH